jgi:hypothetical protein
MYKEKYIKYKIKYFDLKSQLGGMPLVMRGVPLPLNTTRKGTALPHIPFKEMYTYVKSAISPTLEQKEQRDKEITNKIAERKKKKEEAEAAAATAAADKKKNNKKNNKKDKKKDEEKDEASGEIIHSGAVSSDGDESSDDNSSTSTTSTDPTIRIVRESRIPPKPAPIPYLGFKTSQPLPPPVRLVVTE